jgi:hypothetical protein
VSDLRFFCQRTISSLELTVAPEGYVENVIRTIEAKLHASGLRTYPVQRTQTGDPITLVWELRGLRRLRKPV